MTVFTKNYNSILTELIVCLDEDLSEGVVGGDPEGESPVVTSSDNPEG